MPSTPYTTINVGQYLADCWKNDFDGATTADGGVNWEVVLSPLDPSIREGVIAYLTELDRSRRTTPYEIMVAYLEEGKIEIVSPGGEIETFEYAVPEPPPPPSPLPKKGEPKKIAIKVEAPSPTVFYERMPTADLWSALKESQLQVKSAQLSAQSARVRSNTLRQLTEIKTHSPLTIRSVGGAGLGGGGSGSGGLGGLGGGHSPPAFSSISVFAPTGAMTPADRSAWQPYYSSDLLDHLSSIDRKLGGSSPLRHWHTLDYYYLTGLWGVPLKWLALFIWYGMVWSCIVLWQLLLLGWPFIWFFMRLTVALFTFGFGGFSRKR